MKLQDVLLKAMAKKIGWWDAAAIIGVTDRTMRRWREWLEAEGYSGLVDRRKGQPSDKRVPLARWPRGLFFRVGRSRRQAPVESASGRADQQRPSELLDQRTPVRGCRGGKRTGFVCASPVGGRELVRRSPLSLPQERAFRECAGVARKSRFWNAPSSRCKPLPDRPKRFKSNIYRWAGCRRLLHMSFSPAKALARAAGSCLSGHFRL